jgi:hypothetical protein
METPHSVEWLANKEWEWGIFGPYCRKLFSDYSLEPPKNVTFNPRMDVTRFAGGYAEINATAFAAVSSFTSETNLWTLPNIWTYIPLGNMRAGGAFECRGGGIYSTAATGPTAQVVARIGVSATPSSNVAMGTCATFTLGNAVSAQPWAFQYSFVVNRLGLATAGAQAVGHGWFDYWVSATASGNVVFGGVVASTIDNTIANGFMLSAICSTAAASTSFTTQWVMLRQLN